MNTEPEKKKTIPGEPSNGNRLTFLYISMLLVTGIFTFYVLDPEKHRFFWHCPFHALTGLWCPGCGGQRALHALLHARILDALSLNALAVLIVAPIILYAYAAYALQLLCSTNFPDLKLTTRRLFLLLAVFMLFGILRNIPAPPFSWLAP